MQVVLEAIEFNHDRGSATGDAFNIRRNETEVVNVPEWRRSISVKPEDSPAAYARDELQGRTPTIKVRFSFLGFDPAMQTVRIRAVDGRLTPKLNANESSKLLLELLKPVLREALKGNVLGSVLEREVRLKGGAEFELFSLDHVNIANAGVSVSDIIWRWQFRTNSTNWTDFATTTHRIFTVLAMPTSPWQPKSFDNSNTQQPWVEVLDHACRWAAMATDINEAATLVTRCVSALGQGLVHYDNHHSGNTSFTRDSPPSFDCTDFLLLLRGQTNLHGNAVNCDDCSAFVASFTNILGCALSEAQMDRSFPLHPHLRIGAPELQTDKFAYHTVAWKGACGEDDEVFDACVQLDSDLEPADEPHPLFVPANIRFGRLDEQLYRFRLTSNQHLCNPVEGTAVRRRIGFPKLEWETVARTAITPSMENRDGGQSATSRIFSLLLTDFGSANDFAPWKLMALDFMDDTDSLISTQSFYRLREDADVAIEIDAHASLSDKTASDKVKKLLSRFQLLDIKQQTPPEFGDVLHTVPQRFVVVFARGPFVFRLRNVGTRLVSCESFAKAIDALLIKHLNLSATPGNIGQKRNMPAE